MEELIPIFFFLCVAGVLIFRPVTKRLGLLLEEMARDRRAMRSGEGAQMERVATLLERMNTRLELLEDRVEFVERLTDGQTRNRSRLSRVAD